MRTFETDSIPVSAHVVRIDAWRVLAAMRRTRDGVKRELESIQQSRASYPRESQARAPSVRRLHSIVCANR